MNAPTHTPSPGRSGEAERAFGNAAINRRRHGAGSPAGKAGEIAAELERRLMIGTYRFGELLSIGQLATQFDASRQPVSMAISHLRGLGFVDVIPQVGCRVVSPSLAEIADFFFVLGKLEGAIASFAAARYQYSEADALVAIAARREPKALTTYDERVDYIHTLNEYLDQVWLMARSTALEQRLARLRQLSIFYLWQGSASLAPVSAKQLIGERREIASAIAARDADAAERLMAAHIAHKPNVSGVL